MGAKRKRASRGKSKKKSKNNFLLYGVCLVLLATILSWHLMSNTLDETAPKSKPSAPLASTSFSTASSTLGSQLSFPTEGKVHALSPSAPPSSLASAPPPSSASAPPSSSASAPPPSSPPSSSPPSSSSPCPKNVVDNYKKVIQTYHEPEGGCVVHERPPKPGLDLLADLKNSTWKSIMQGIHDDFTNLFCISKSELGNIPYDFLGVTLAPVMHKIVSSDHSTGPSTTILVLGGSVTSGGHCAGLNPPQGHQWCAWSVWLGLHLQKVNLGKVQVVNKALGGHTTCAYAQIASQMFTGHMEIKQFDLIILDFNINDIHGGKGPYAACAERFVQLLRNRFPNATIVMFDVKKNEEICNINQKLAETYPYVGNLQIGSITTTKKRWQWPHNEGHPGGMTHRYLGTMMAWAILASLGEEAFSDLPQLASTEYSSSISNCVFSEPSTTVVSQEQLDELNIPLSPRASYVAMIEYYREQNGLAPRDLSDSIKVISGDWSLREDVKGKPGWIATEDGAEIQFKMSLGPEPSLTFMILRSYEKLGNMVFRVGTYKNGDPIEKDAFGIWEKHNSQAATITIHRGGRWQLPINQEEHWISIKTKFNSKSNSAKVKILAVQSV